MTSILIVGHSHVNCLMAAQRAKELTQFEVWNFRSRMPDGSLRSNLRGICNKSLLRNPDPDVICLCVNGNYHNVLTLLENPEPFSIGTASGAAPDDPARWFIPQNTMLDALRHSLAPIRASAETLYESFPGATRLYFNPPPPSTNFEALKNHSTAFKDSLHLGPGPDALKHCIYELQTRVLREFADSMGAHFVEPPAEIRDDGGFLDESYQANDPTHGNTAYGAIMLDRILQSARVEA